MSQTVWPLNENGEVVLSTGTGSGNIAGYLNQDVLPSADSGSIPVKLDGLVSGNTMSSESANILSKFGDVVAKAFVKTAADTYYLSTSKSGTNSTQLVYELKTGVVTSTDSVGGNAQLLRVTKVTETLRSFVAVHNQTTNSNASDWTQSSYSIPSSAGGFGAGGWGTSLKYRQTTVQNAWGEYSITVGDDCKFSVGIQVGTTQSSSVKVSLDGVDIDTFTSVSTGTNIYIKEYRAPAGTHTVRITKLDATGAAIRIFGVNFFDVRNAPIGNSYDSWAYARTANFYKQNQGAIDYAMKEKNGLWSGSYHGGETSVSLQILADSVDISSVATSAVTVAKDIVINQRTTINTGTSSVSTSSSTRWLRAGGHSFQCVVDTGTTSFEEFYTFMGILEPSFINVDYPVLRDYTSTPTDTRDPLGLSEIIVQRNPTTGQVGYVWSRQFDTASNLYSGLHVWHVAGTYSKPYNGPVVKYPAGRKLGVFSWQTIHIYA